MTRTIRLRKMVLSVFSRGDEELTSQHALFAKPSLAARAEFFMHPKSEHYRFVIFGETGSALVSSTGFKSRDEAWSTLLRAVAGTRGLVIHDRTTGLTHTTP